MKSKTLSVCNYCGVEFLALTKNIRRGWGKYCSHRCSSKTLIGEKNPNYRGDKKLTRKQSKQRTKEKNPEKHLARASVTKALRNGILVRLPCGVCGSEKSEGHHDDYSKPLEVRWLCRKHHSEIHKGDKKGIEILKKNPISRRVLREMKRQSTTSTVEEVKAILFNAR